MNRMHRLIVLVAATSWAAAGATPTAAEPADTTGAKLVLVIEIEGMEDALMRQEVHGVLTGELRALLGGVEIGTAADQDAALDECEDVLSCDVVVLEQRAAEDGRAMELGVRIYSVKGEWHRTIHIPPPPPEKCRKDPGLPQNWERCRNDYFRSYYAPEIVKHHGSHVPPEGGGALS